ncbi:MAG: hypothetical protein GY782_01715 [Gammaproteobacteria bacterium]|nr:hypothetical protein [Gammaproteobacteria bacterium]
MSCYPIDMRLAIALFFTWLLIIIAAIDCAHLIIPDPLNYILLWSGLALTLLPHLSLLTAAQAITGAIIGYLSLWTIATVFFHIHHAA